MICKGLRPKEKNPPVPKLTSQQRGKFLSMPTGRLELLAPKTIHGERAMLPFPLQKVKPGCGPIPWRRPARWTSPSLYCSMPNLSEALNLSRRGHA